MILRTSKGLAVANLKDEDAGWLMREVPGHWRPSPSDSKKSVFEFDGDTVFGKKRNLTGEEVISIFIWRGSYLSYT